MYNQKLNAMTAVITGGNGVIGGVFARALAGEGADIAIICRNTGSAEGVMKDIRELEREAAVFQGDVLSREDMLSCREEILTRFGHINMLVNCAGGALKGAAVPQDQYSEDSKEEGNFFTTASEKIHQEFDLNIYGTILPTQIFGEVLIGQENANIINVSSMGAYHPMTRIPGYAGAKAAVTNFTEWAATYFAKSGVRVNAVAPGFFQTPQNHDLQFFPDGTPTPRTNKIIAATPMGRFGKPEELASAVLFLADPSSSFVTGTVIPVDGGFHCYPGV